MSAVAAYKSAHAVTGAARTADAARKLTSSPTDQRRGSRGAVTWAKYDDALPFNRKAAWLRAHGERGIAALGLHLLANTWSRHEGMQGFIPEYMPEQLAGRTGPKLAELLEGIDMFTRTDNGWMINDYEEYGDRDDGTPTTERIARISKVRSEAGKLGGLAKAGKRPSKTAGKKLPELQQTSAPVPEPVPAPKSGRTQEGGNGHLSDADGRAIWPTHCLDHRRVENPGPCGGCQKQREAAEKLDAQRDADRAANCRRCGGSNWIEAADGSPARKCNHLDVAS